MSGWSALLGIALKALFEALTAAFLGRRADQERSAITREAGALTAAIETKDVINDVAQKQADLNARSPDLLDIAGRLRAQADRATGGRPGNW